MRVFLWWRKILNGLLCQMNVIVLIVLASKPLIWTKSNGWKRRNKRVLIFLIYWKAKTQYRWLMKIDQHSWSGFWSKKWKPNFNSIFNKMKQMESPTKGKNAKQMYCEWSAKSIEKCNQMEFNYIPTQNSSTPFVDRMWPGFPIDSRCKYLQPLSIHSAE